MAKLLKRLDDYRVITASNRIVLRTNMIKAAKEYLALNSDSSGMRIQQVQENPDKTLSAWTWVDCNEVNP